MILDLYAGAGGWDVGAQILGLPTVGLEIEHDPCVTAVKAGHPRIRCDVAAYPTAPFVGKLAGLVASPPCQAWSMAGNRLGELDRARVHGLVDAYAAGDYGHGGDWADPRSHHAAQPVRWIRDLRPDWVCLEQVPGVIDLWRHIGDVLRGWGYSVVTQVLCAADYGVPQTRERTILIASRVRPAVMPETTHEKDPQPSLFGERLPWVSMAEALGWSGATLTKDLGAGMVERYGDRPDRDMSEPAFTITAGSKGSGPRLHWSLDRQTRSKAAGWRTNPGQSSMVPTPPVDTDRAAPTLTGNTGQWVLRNNTNVNACERSADQPAGTLFFGRRLNNVSWIAGDEERRIAIAEAALLQSFPADYPWAGNKTSTFMQVGNAVPPRLAAAVIGAAAGIDWQPAVEAFYAQPALGVAS